MNAADNYLSLLSRAVCEACGFPLAAHGIWYAQEPPRMRCPKPSNAEPPPPASRPETAVPTTPEPKLSTPMEEQ